jgi:DNA-binding HxlR family transcriptional regulator
MSAEINSSCPVCKTAEVVCGKWTLLLIRDLAEGNARFCELERSLEGISPRTLSLRLRALEEEGIVARHTYPEVPPRVEYALAVGRRGRPGQQAPACRRLSYRLQAIIQAQEGPPADGMRRCARLPAQRIDQAPCQ